jgi:hypothetical protein
MFPIDAFIICLLDAVQIVAEGKKLLYTLIVYPLKCAK